MTHCPDRDGSRPPQPGPAAGSARNPGGEFPFWDGRPVPLSARQWLVLMIAVAAAYGFLVVPLPLLPTVAGQFLRVVAFAVLPLAVLARLAGRHWRALFRPLRAVDVLWMALFAAATLAATLVIGLLGSLLIDLTPNRAVAGVARQEIGAQALFFLRSAIQLFGEELLAILPFLAMMALCRARGLPRRRAILLAWLGSSLVFALAHLQTYDWNLAQCLLMLVPVRLILTLPYLLTRNILVSTGAHVLNDWVIVAVAIAATA